MIPASYLYKDTFRQHWGREFGRIDAAAPAQPKEMPHWPTLSGARDLFGLALGRHGRR